MKRNLGIMLPTLFLVLLGIFLLNLIPTALAAEQDASPAAQTLYPARLSKSGKKEWGYIDFQGHAVIPAAFDSARPFCEGLACVRIYDRGVGFIDMSGKQIVEFVYRSAGDFSEGLAWVETMRESKSPSSGIGYINRKGRVIVEAKYSWGSDMRDGLAVVLTGATCAKDLMNWGYIDRNGREVSTLTYLYAIPYHEGFGCVEIPKREFFSILPEPRKSKGFFIVDRNMQILNELPMKQPARFYEGLAYVEFLSAQASQSVGGNKDHRMLTGYMDTSGTMVINLHGKHGGPFSEGLAWVHEATPSYYKEGYHTPLTYIDQKGREAFFIPYAIPGFASKHYTPRDINYHFYSPETRSDFKEGRAFVLVPQEIIPSKPPVTKSQYAWKMIDRSGEYVTNAAYEWVTAFHNGRAFVEMDGQVRLINRAGQPVGTNIYDRPKDAYPLTPYVFRDGLALVFLDDRTAYIDREGNVVWKECE